MLHVGFCCFQIVDAKVNKKNQESKYNCVNFVLFYMSLCIAARKIASVILPTSNFSNTLRL